MSRWFRHYAGMMRDDKLVRVAIKTKQSIERVLWVWGAILESASEIDDGGRFDVDEAEMAYFLRADEADICAITDALRAASRLDGGCVAHWGDRQFSSDRSKDRVAAYRERKKTEKANNNSAETNRHGDGNDGVTLQERLCNSPETDTELDTETEKKNYKFRGRVVRLTAPDFDRWAKSFPNLDLVAVLESRDTYLSEQPKAIQAKWFQSTATWLANQNQKWRTAQAPPNHAEMELPC